MKRLLLLSVFSLFMFAPLASADVLPVDYRQIPGCAILQGASTFSDTQFLVAIKTWGYDNDADSLTIKPLENDECIHTDRGQMVDIFAVDPAQYVLDSKHQNYDLFKDLNAYPMQMGPGSNEAFNAGDALVPVLNKATTLRRYYAIDGIDNSKRSIRLSFLGDVTDVSDSRLDFPPPAGLDHTIKINTPIFKDLDVSSPYALAVATLKRQGAIQGYADGTFRPDDLVNRGEFIKTLTPSYTSPIDCSKQIFKDVPPLDTNWLRNPVCYANAYRIVDGYSDNTFRPSNPINFAEAATFIFRYHEYPYSRGDATDPWYKKYIDAFQQIDGVPSTIASPSQRITRGEMALLIYRGGDLNIR